MKILRRNYSLYELYIFRKAFIGILFSYKKVINFFLVELSVLLRLKRNLGSPLHVLIEPTARCNYQCVKCEKFIGTYEDDGLVEGSMDMSFGNFCKIIDDIGDRLLTLRLWHYGEPLLNESLFEMVKYAKKKNVFVVTSSNISLLNEKAGREMISSGLDYLIVSCDGASEHTYKLYHGRDCFNIVEKNLKGLIAEKKKSGSLLPFIELQFIIMRENEKEIEEIRKFADQLGVNKLTYLRLQANRLDIQRIKNVKSIEDILPQKNSFRFSDRDRARINFCCLPWEETVIRYSGLVIPCAFDIGQTKKMGRLFEEGAYIGLNKIWNNASYVSLRRHVRRELENSPTCSCCEKRNNNNNDQINIQ